ncbi:hypothetical protein DACRYDRAFT_115322 [Dacryopinax primogenitus]|uniref:Uncharacterized protein n=1 Tax=Dacryopinax primogenitus (strain DJM 731) TaxID=1858805 RepID=M5G4A0_DACPD|nr:uncharacterized protein DACRYDRAFT_115322 [Dacryopinax primogenitus]EJU03050.1 hypothetical protein DACRYDRAFT_115322 [Dacryopinax primogenitus]
MDEDPVPLIKKRQARHLRAAGRVRATDEDGDTGAEASADDSRPPSPSESPASIPAKLKKKSKLATRLSFGGNDTSSEGPAFNVKKSNLSRRISLRDHPSLVADTGASTSAAEERPSYSAEDLASLKASTPSTALRQKARQSVVVDDDADGGASGSGMDDFAYEQLMGSVDNMEIDTGTLADENITLGTQTRIAFAREKRAEARKMPKHEGLSLDNSKDFISLDINGPGEERAQSGPHPGSRLVREDDELGEGDDEAAEYTGAQERIALGKKAREKEAQNRRAALVEAIDEVEAGSDDSESREWELAQERRANITRLSPDSDEKREIYRAPPIPTIIPIPTLAAQQARLSLLLEDLTRQHLLHTKALDAVEKEREDLSQNQARVRREIEELKARQSQVLL